MAKSRSNKGVDLKPDISDQQRKARSGRGDQLVMHGILGEERDGHVRVYLNYELSAYAMVPVADITSRERTKDDDGTELSVLKVNRSARLEVVRVTREQVEADFLEEALRTSANVQFPSADLGPVVAVTPATPTITLATRYLCTKAACRITTVCTLVCTVVCPKPWTRNWFCR
jgi:hypothetical protein